MEQEEDFKFDISEPAEKFGSHLNMLFNDRIILSAPFGAGKTYFLKEFFKNNNQYEVIHLFPVKYSVASNEDIFELIKYDILFELMGKPVEFEKVQFNKLDYLPLFVKNHKSKALKPIFSLLSFIPTVGKSLSDFSNNLLSFIEEFEKEFERIPIDDEKATINYLKSFTQKKGSIYEEDFYTQLICQLVNQLKEKTDNQLPEKETVLIIDDLDRIDPEHIFRILNVLSAQMDLDAPKNKFDFDKIILVFDQKNVRNIFRNRYGTSVDFSGYIDKFYSHKIFEFNNSLGINKKIISVLNSITIPYNQIDFSLENDFIQAIVLLFRKLIEVNAITTRTLLKIKDASISNNLMVPIKFKNNGELYYKSQFEILSLANLLYFVFNDWDDLLNGVKRLFQGNFIESRDNVSYIEEIIKECVILLDSNQHNFETKAQFRFTHNQTKLGFSYHLLKSGQKGNFTCKNDSPILQRGINSSFINLLLDTLTKIRDNNFLFRDYR